MKDEIRARVPKETCEYLKYKAFDKHISKAELVRQIVIDWVSKDLGTVS